MLLKSIFCVAIICLSIWLCRILTPRRKPPYSSQVLSSHDLAAPDIRTRLVLDPSRWTFRGGKIERSIMNLATVTGTSDGRQSGKKIRESQCEWLTKNGGFHPRTLDDRAIIEQRRLGVPRHILTAATLAFVPFSTHPLAVSQKNRDRTADEREMERED